jgi:hypothetical protein
MLKDKIVKQKKKAKKDSIEKKKIEFKKEKLFIIVIKLKPTSQP